MDAKAWQVVPALHSSWKGFEWPLVKRIFETWRRISMNAVELGLVPAMDLNECQCISYEKLDETKHKVAQFLVRVLGSNPYTDDWFCDVAWMKYETTNYWGVQLRVWFTSDEALKMTTSSIPEDFGSAFESSIASKTSMDTTYRNSDAQDTMSLQERNELIDLAGLHGLISFRRPHSGKNSGTKVSEKCSTRSTSKADGAKDSKDATKPKEVSTENSKGTNVGSKRKSADAVQRPAKRIKSQKPTPQPRPQSARVDKQTSAHSRKQYQAYAESDDDSETGNPDIKPEPDSQPSSPHASNRSAVKKVKGKVVEPVIAGKDMVNRNLEEPVEKLEAENARLKSLLRK
ncbi:uncharacterized protein K452DRAFT_362322 [Aplosporella prunicola CBS 121167]|uniref:Uncharacterized protein n=1 Tax=Aplosporella prunicola CBS 121167 TaxID=1176127 RepID=A0A6A6B098_9PEZI|nr:uncharacterized protein K452DRAFT_322630 [Aplosporella prunicola CBS 121167]XP_033392512.1 uncharacterized protein K452DRAFT_362322 [Aplosporella prunicola CBS 121167]KAF2136131.1 hypothetical protein K452DRAFT_322630 [Aplosporella prunicola CBS 121167]KAF2136794.1 hypothetical protein K452DRAFT_362322 [Aplosporella prunicola CBS 121167]